MESTHFKEDYDSEERYVGKNKLLKTSEIEPIRKREKINQYNWRQDRYEQTPHFYGVSLDNKNGLYTMDPNKEIKHTFLNKKLSVIQQEKYTLVSVPGS